MKITPLESLSAGLSSAAAPGLKSTEQAAGSME
jgi:hypothetical protein